MTTDLLKTIVDEGYLLGCTPEEKLVYIYALIRVGADGLGTYSIPLEAFRLGIEESALKRILDKFEESFVLFYYDGYIAIPYYNMTIKTIIPFSSFRDDISSHVSDYFMYRMEEMCKQIHMTEQQMIEIAQEM